jgi:hypothetical protein
MTPERIQDVVVLRVATGEFQNQLGAYAEACHARVVNGTTKHVVAIRACECRASLVEHPWHPRVSLEFAVERIRFHHLEVLRAP